MSELSTNPLPRRNKKQTVAAVFFWIGLVLFLGSPLLIIISEFVEAQRQHHIVSTYQPVKARVLSSEVKQWKDSHGVDQYAAAIRYKYEVNGQTYQSDRVTPVYISSSQEWADSLAATYKAGQACDAFYDPANPSQAVLLRRYFFSPYYYLLEGAFCLTVGCFAVLRLWFGKQPKLTSADNGWYAIAPEIGQRQRLLTAKVCVIAWYVSVSVPAAHYFLCVPSPHNHVRIFEIFYALGLIPVFSFARYWRMNRNMDEARFLVDQPEGLLGRRLRFSVTQMARRQVELKQAAVHLQCLGFKNKSKSVVFETTLAAVKERVLHTGEELKLSGEITLPADQPPTGRAAAGKFERIGWKLLMRCEMRHAPGYSTEYRFEVKAPPAEIPEPAVKTTVRADVRSIAPEFAGRIMSKRNFAVGQLLTFIPVLIQFPSAVFVLVCFLALFPSQNDPKILSNVPKQQLHQMLEIGIGLTIVSSIWGLAGPGRLRVKYFQGVAKREIRRRPDAIVQPNADSQFVTIIPRENWNRAMWKEQKDCGLLTVDTARREIRFEGDNERYCIPVDALLSCDVEKSVFTSNAKPTAPGYFMVVLRVQTDSGIWEAPLAPSAATSIFNSKSRQRAAEALQAKIKALSPALVTGETSTRPAV